MERLPESIQHTLEELAGSKGPVSQYRDLLEVLAAEQLAQLQPYYRYGPSVEQLTIASLRKKADELLQRRNRMQIPGAAGKKFENQQRREKSTPAKNVDERWKKRHVSLVDPEEDTLGQHSET